MRFNMNRKLFSGLAVAGFASLFWACGSGDIVETNVLDELQLASYNENPEALESFILQAVTASCSDTVLNPDGTQTINVDESCVNAAKPGSLNEGSPTESSSSSPKQNSPYTNRSSSGTFNPFQQNPTSSGNPGSTSSLGQTHNPSSTPSLQPTSNATTSSSAAPADPNAWGTCAANTKTNSIKKGASVQWKIAFDNSKVSANIMTGASYSWTFQDGNPATMETKTYTSNSVSYATSGSKDASVTVSFQGKTNTIKCTPLDVTGAEIKSCVCNPNVTQADVASQTPVTWTVSGCASTDANFTYVWSDQLQGGNAASAVLTAKGTYAPSVTVKNGDNGMMTVQCGAITAIDSNHPDYVVKTAGQQGEIDLPAGQVTVLLQVDAYNGKVICNADGPISGTVNTTTVLNGSYYVSVPMSGLKKGAQLVFELSTPAKCGVE